MFLYRVFWHHEGAVPGEQGTPTYIGSQGHGRADNPDHYPVLYTAESAECAIVETIGNFSTWTQELFLGPYGRRALATFDIPAGAVSQILDLDHGLVLHERSMRPSHVCTERRAVTQAWALQAWQESQWVGLRWWSYWLAEWSVVALWAPEILTLRNIETLDLAHPLVESSARQARRKLSAA